VASRGFPIRLVVALVVAVGVGIPSLWGLLRRHLFHPVALYLDNGGGDDEVRVSLDGDTPVPVAKWSVVRREISSGKHKLIATTATGAGVDEQEFEATGDVYIGDAYVFNIGGRSKYAIYTQAYSRSRTAGFGEEERPEPCCTDRVFAVPVGVGRDFAGAFPATITRERHDSSPMKERRVYHAPLHSDRPCCAAYDQ
jgi:hypothetical protein